MSRLAAEAESSVKRIAVSPGRRSPGLTESAGLVCRRPERRAHMQARVASWRLKPVSGAPRSTPSKCPGYLQAVLSVLRGESERLGRGLVVPAVTRE